LWRTTYAGYYDGDPTWFDAHTPIESTAVDNFDLYDGDIFSSQWLGYFKAPHTATYTFYRSSDDASGMWLGGNAITGYTDLNQFEGTIGLEEGQLVPIRLQYGNAGGPKSLNFSWEDDYTPPPPTGATIQLSDLQYAGAQWTGNPGLALDTYTNAGWDYIGFNNAGLYNTLFSLLNGDGKLAVTWSAGSTVTNGYVNVNFDGNTTFQFVPVVDAAGSDNYPGSWVFPATFSVIP
jgi:hypothetical protein